MTKAPFVLSRLMLEEYRYPSCVTAFLPFYFITTSSSFEFIEIEFFKVSYFDGAIAIAAIIMTMTKARTAAAGIVNFLYLPMSFVRFTAVEAAPENALEADLDRVP